MSKKRVLFVGEYSQVSTGFATIARHLLPELYAKHSDKFEIAELACYLPEGHPNADIVPWKVYGNRPPQGDNRSNAAFDSNPQNEFGLWSFDKVLLDFQPHVVVTWRDPWFDQFIHKHPYRRFFKFVHMPTCDGTPQKHEWLSDTASADLILTYSFWAKMVLERETNGAIKVFDVASPPIDTDAFKIQDKIQLRKNFGVPEDTMIFGACMRNQPRKLFPDFMKGFTHYLDVCKDNNRTDLINKSFLWFHTTYPDLGWDFAEEIKRHNLGHKILFTYSCQCGAVYPAFFSGELAFCRECNKRTASMPNTGNGVSREMLGKIYNCWDLLGQISCSEGFGMGQNEAKACGCPILTTDHSAMTEQGNSPGGMILPVSQLVQESQHQTNQLRAYIAPDVLGELLYNFSIKPESERTKMGLDGSKFVHEQYSIENIASIWVRALEYVNVENLPSWDSPAKLINPVTQNIPANLPPIDFVKWCYYNILQSPEELHSYEAYKSIQVLEKGCDMSIDGSGRAKREPIDYEKYVKYLLGKVQNYNQLEMKRINKFASHDTKRVAVMEI